MHLYNIINLYILKTEIELLIIFHYMQKFRMRKKFKVSFPPEADPPERSLFSFQRK